MDGDRSLLSELKVVEPGYPYYGKVELASGRPFNEALKTGNVLVGQLLLDRLHLQIGDRLRIGNAILIIRDVVLAEPDRPANLFALGPRIFIASADLASLDLIGKGSRVEYNIFVKAHDQKELKRIDAQLSAAAVKDRERVETYQTANSGVKRFFDNLIFFLDLNGIFTLLLAGIGIQSTLTALLKEQEGTIAIMKALGARSRLIVKSYLSTVALLGLVGMFFGVAASFLIQEPLHGLFLGLLPANVELNISWGTVIEGFLLGSLVVFIFAALPLYRLKEVKPRAIFGKDEQSDVRSLPTWLAGVAVILLFLVMVFWRIRDVKAGLNFILGFGLLIIVSFVYSEGVLHLLRKNQKGSLILRQAVKGLFRQHNATRSIIVTLTASLFVIFSITIVEKNLDGDFIRSYPPDAPNLFLIDIQPEQKEEFARTLGLATAYYPIVRGTVIAVNGEPIDQEKERKKRGDNMAREFNLTYRQHLMESEQLIAGHDLFRKDWPEAQVSVLDTVLKMRDMHIGDTITFRIMGISMGARVSSIRTRTGTPLQPYFYFVFPKEFLKDAPQTLFAAVRVNKGEIATLQNRIVARFPNVSVIDMSETVKVFARVMSKLSAIVRFFSLFSVVAGVLIIISSIFATRFTRIQEAVFFTIIGAKRRFVLAVYTTESLCLGLASALSALILAQSCSWIICRFAFDVPYQPFIIISLLMVLAAMLLVITVGLGASLTILRQKPVQYLREQNEE
jgi:putative ABC transport system permease protein